MKFKQLILLAGLLGSAAIASAQVTTATSTTQRTFTLSPTVENGMAYFGMSPVTIPVAGSFSDVFNMSWSGISSAFASGSVIDLAQIFPSSSNFSQLSLNIYDGLNGSGSVLGTGTRVSGALVGDNDFSIRVSGTTTGPGAAYAMVASVSPIPEPGTYAMFLAGLAAVSFVVRRRAAHAAA